MASEGEALDGTGAAKRGPANRDHWFSTARWGMFIHWGIYSARGYEPSWPLVGGMVAFPHGQDVPVADYYRDAAAWVPPEGAPREWIALAKQAGMQYAVLTTKHHDGFTLFPSEHSDFGIGHNAPGRDLVREFVDACRDEGLRVGLYFSLPDWHHPDYPAFTDEMRPYANVHYPRPGTDRWASFMDDLRGQLHHLLTDYRTIDELWFDGGWERTPDEWDAEGIETFIRERQPDVVINERLPGVGDYQSPEQGLPDVVPDGWWETCLTMNTSWGPVLEDDEYKSTRELLMLLADAASGGGNVLINISPDGDGHVLAPQRERLEAIGAWMATHGEAIVGTQRGLEPGRFYGPTTTKGNRTYLFCPMRPQEEVVLRSFRGERIESVRALGTDKPLDWHLRLSAMNRLFPGDPICDVIIHVPDDACDDLMTVIEVTSRDSA